MTNPHDKALEAARAAYWSTENDPEGERDMEKAISAYLSSIGGVVCSREPVAWRWRTEIFREWTVDEMCPGTQEEMERQLEINMQGLEVEPLHAPVEAVNGGDGWLPIETMPTDRQFLAFGYYFYPGDKAPTIYTMIAEASFGDPEWPYRTNEGTHRKGFFSHWCDLPKSPAVGYTPSNEGEKQS